MPRLFVAIDLPDEIKTELSVLCSGLPGARWVKREQTHVTLRFIGEVDNAMFETIKGAMATIQAAKFEMRLEGIGQFPLTGTPRVLWAGLRAPAELNKLQTQVEQVIQEVGLGKADHPFSAHLTLARFKTQPEREAVEAYFVRHRSFQTKSFSVKQFILYSSVLGREGSAYRYEGVYVLQPT